jgi:hypothetical protein
MEFGYKSRDLQLRDRNAIRRSSGAEKRASAITVIFKETNKLIWGSRLVGVRLEEGEKSGRAIGRGTLSCYLLEKQE